jgi:hypothetical protein
MSLYNHIALIGFPNKAVQVTCVILGWSVAVHCLWFTHTGGVCLFPWTDSSFWDIGGLWHPLHSVQLNHSENRWAVLDACPDYLQKEKLDGILDLLVATIFV